MFKKMDGGGVAMTYRQSDAGPDVHPMPRKLGAPYVRFVRAAYFVFVWRVLT